MSIPARAKPGIYRRLRRITAGDAPLPAVIGGTALQERHGRALKLGSGLVMLALAGTLLVAPHLLLDLRGTVAVFGGAAAVTTLVLLVERRRAAVAASGDGPHHGGWSS